MNIYLIKLKEVGYDQYDGWVVQAEDEETAIKLCDIKDNDEPTMRDNQYKGNIDSIDIIGITNSEKEKIILGSYNAG